MATKTKPPTAEPETTEEARGYLEEAERLERARPVLENRVVLGEVPEMELRALDRRVSSLRERAETVMTPEKQRATQEQNARQIREREEASERMRLGSILSDAILRYRGEEYARLGVMPDGAAYGRVEIPKARILRIVNEAEDLLGGSGVCAEDAQRQIQLVQVYGASSLVGKTYEEAASAYLGRSAREVRDEALDRFLGILLDAESGALVDAAAEPGATTGEEPPDVA